MQLTELSPVRGKQRQREQASRISKSRHQNMNAFIFKENRRVIGFDLFLRFQDVL